MLAFACVIFACLRDCPWHQGRTETFGGACAQSIKGEHGKLLLIGLCSLLICVSKWMLLDTTFKFKC